MARTSNSDHLWKETPATSMTKAQLVVLANAKDIKLKELRRKNKAQKATLKELRAALVAAKAAQATDTATSTLVPKPHGTSGRGDFNLADAMGIETTMYHEIQGFVRSLVNMSAIDKTEHWKNQPGDEIHKIFTVTAGKYPIMATFQYNWATAEMVKLYLRNSRAQAQRKAKTGTRTNANAAPTDVPGFTDIDTGAGANTGLSGTIANPENDSDSDDSDDE